MKSSSHPLIGHDFTIEFITPAGAKCICPNL
jgi:hypothetical protein